MITLEGITVWVVLAFMLWLAITLGLHHALRRQGGVGVVAAVLSWLIAGAAVSMMTPWLHWLHGHL